MDDKTIIKSIIMFILGIIFSSCIWIIVMFPTAPAAILATIALVIMILAIMIFAIQYLIMN